MISWLQDISALGNEIRELPVWVAVFVVGWSFGVGAVVGSFLNVVIYRLPRGMRVSEPKRSHCPGCDAQIAWFDNLPILSWMLLRARCRRCKMTIDFRYPFVEALVGMMAVGVVFRFGFSGAGLSVFAFATVLIAIAYIDLDTFTIPFSTLAALVIIAMLSMGLELWTGHPLGTVVSGLAQSDNDVSAALRDRGIGLVAGFSLLYAFKVLADVFFRATGRIAKDEEAMGFGDPLLLGAIGLFLGWQGLPMVVFLGSVQGSIAGIALKFAGRLHQGGQVSEDDEDTLPAGSVPFGPFLALGALEVAFFGAAWLPEIYSRIFHVK